jgi:hypothetical protein
MQWLAIFLFSLGISCIESETEASQLDYTHDELFKRWCAELCESESEEYLARIYPTWRENAEFVEKQNRLGLPYSVSLNRFAHLSLEEFSKSRLRQLKRNSSPAEFRPVLDRDPPPISVDWRNKGVVPPVENQGQCGDTVPFQVVHAVDSLHAIQTGTLELGSVEEYVDCCEDGPCDGGIYGLGSYDCIVKIGGLALQSVYVSPDHKCLNDTFKSELKIEGGKSVIPYRNETALEYAVAMRPVVAAIDAGHASFQLYEGGVYYEPDCSSVELDHVVLVVGYGATEDGVEYWICQNSWGE